MRLLFQRDLTPHPQYLATYKWLQRPEEQGGFGAQAIVHFGMHGTVEWLPGQPLGNDRSSWSDEMLGNLHPGEAETSAVSAPPNAPLDVDVLQLIYDVAERNGMTKDVPLHDPTTMPVQSAIIDENLSKEAAEKWILDLAEYLNVLQDRLFSSGLHVLGSCPTVDDMVSYLEAYFGERHEMLWIMGL